jgi:hypothetical protein
MSKKKYLSWLLSFLLLGYVSESLAVYRAFGYPICGNYSPMLFGTIIHQKPVNESVGYNLSLGGGFLSVEVNTTKFAKVGVALSGYGCTYRINDTPLVRAFTIEQSNISPAAYLTLQYGILFASGTVSVGNNRYRMKRTSVATDQQATARFVGLQSALQGRVGVALPFGTLEITPIASIDFVKMRRAAFTEVNGIDIAISGSNIPFGGGDISGSQTAIGIRFADISEPEIFYPELHLFSFGDNSRVRLHVFSRFVDGLPPMILEGNTPGASGFNAGASITGAIRGENLKLTLSYDYLQRKGFQSSVIYLRGRWFF